MNKNLMVPAGANAEAKEVLHDISKGTEVIPNPTLSGREPSLTGLQVGNEKFRVLQPINPVTYGTSTVTVSGLDVPDLIEGVGVYVREFKAGRRVFFNNDFIIINVNESARELYLLYKNSNIVKYEYDNRDMVTNITVTSVGGGTQTVWTLVDGSIIRIGEFNVDDIVQGFVFPYTQVFNIIGIDYDIDDHGFVKPVTGLMIIHKYEYDESAYSFTFSNGEHIAKFYVDTNEPASIYITYMTVNTWGGLYYVCLLQDEETGEWNLDGGLGAPIDLYNIRLTLVSPETDTSVTYTMLSRFDDIYGESPEEFEYIFQNAIGQTVEVTTESGITGRLTVTYVDYDHGEVYFEGIGYDANDDNKPIYMSEYLNYRTAVLNEYEVFPIY